jgi:hypothetical protein
MQQRTIREEREFQRKTSPWWSPVSVDLTLAESTGYEFAGDHLQATHRFDGGSKVSASVYFLFVWAKQEITLWITSASCIQAGKYAMAEPFRRLVFGLTGLLI